MSADRSALVSVKADVFSCAVLLWCLVAGQYPHRGVKMDVFTLMVKISRDGLRPPVDGFPPVLAGLLARCWQPGAEQRPGFAQLLEALQAEDLLQEPVHQLSLAHHHDDRVTWSGPTRM